jgi:nucleoside-diphosphate-sugar epimerase
MRILVTGAAGSLGSNAVVAALARGIDVRMLVRDPARARIPDGAVPIVADARDPDALRQAAEGCDALLHLVNVTFAADWVKTTAALLDAALAACRATGARLVFPANVWVFGRGQPGRRVGETQSYAPCSEKGRARQHKEERIRASGVRHVMVRLPEFYGPHVQTLTGPPLHRIAHRRTATWFGRADAEAEFVYMPDAAEALVTIGLADGVDGELFHLPGAAPITPRQYFTLASELAGGGRLREVPAWLVRAAAPFSASARTFADILHLWTDPIVLDGTKVNARFPSLRPTPYREGLAVTLEWLRQNPDARMYY